MRERSRVLVAGASGALGQHVVEAAASEGFVVRAMGRDRARLDPIPSAQERVVADALDPAQLAEALEGVTVVFSCLGASVSPEPSAGARSYDQGGYARKRHLAAAGPSSSFQNVFGARRWQPSQPGRANERYVEPAEGSNDSLDGDAGTKLSCHEPRRLADGNGMNLAVLARDTGGKPGFPRCERHCAYTGQGCAPRLRPSRREVVVGPGNDPASSAARTGPRLSSPHQQAATA